MKNNRTPHDPAAVVRSLQELELLFGKNDKGSGPRFENYEALKSELTATATTPTEYEAACMLAAEKAGV